MNKLIIEVADIISENERLAAENKLLKKFAEATCEKPVLANDESKDLALETVGDMLVLLLADREILPNIFDGDRKKVSTYDEWLRRISRTITEGFVYKSELVRNFLLNSKMTIQLFLASVDHGLKRHYNSKLPAAQKAEAEAMKEKENEEKE